MSSERALGKHKDCLVVENKQDLNDGTGWDRMAKIYTTLRFGYGMEWYNSTSNNQMIPNTSGFR